MRAHAGGWRPAHSLNSIQELTHFIHLECLLAFDHVVVSIRYVRLAQNSQSVKQVYSYVSFIIVM